MDSARLKRILFAAVAFGAMLGMVIGWGKTDSLPHLAGLALVAVMLGRWIWQAR